MGVTVDARHSVVMGAPTNAVSIKSLGTGAGLLEKTIAKVKLLGGDETVKWSQTDGRLQIERPQALPNENAIVFRVSFK
jgi:hypothetical protein